MSATFWLISALVFGIVEACFPIAVFLFFALGALLTALAALAVQEPLWQAVCFVSMSLLSLVVARQRWRRLFGGTAVAAGESMEHPLEGRRGRLCEEISGNQPGVVEVGGSFWRAVAETPGECLPGGTPVIILGALPGDGLVLQVRALKEDENSAAAL